MQCAYSFNELKFYKREKVKEVKSLKVKSKYKKVQRTAMKRIKKQILQSINFLSIATLQMLKRNYPALNIIFM